MLVFIFAVFLCAADAQLFGWFSPGERCIFVMKVNLSIVLVIPQEHSLIRLGCRTSPASTTGNWQICKRGESPLKFQMVTLTFNMHSNSYHKHLTLVAFSDHMLRSGAGHAVSGECAH